MNKYNVVLLSFLLLSACQSYKINDSKVANSWRGHNVKELDKNYELNKYKKSDNMVGGNERIITFSDTYSIFDEGSPCVTNVGPQYRGAYPVTNLHGPASPQCQSDAPTKERVCIHKFHVRGDKIEDYRSIGATCSNTCKYTREGC